MHFELTNHTKFHIQGIISTIIRMYSIILDSKITLKKKSKLVALYVKIIYIYFLIIRTLLFIIYVYCMLLCITHM
jgi:hypothetical protein